MARNTQSAAELPDLEQRIGELTQQIKERFSSLQQEVTEGQKEMQRLSDQFERLTGKALLDMNGSRAAKPAAKAERGTKAQGRGRGKRTRRPGVSVEWLQEHLSKKGMTVRQLQEKAEEDGLSGLRIPAILKDNKGKFKSEAGEPQPGVKGIPGAVWGVK